MRRWLVSTVNRCQLHSACLLPPVSSSSSCKLTTNHIEASKHSCHFEVTWTVTKWSIMPQTFSMQWLSVRAVRVPFPLRLRHKAKTLQWRSPLNAFVPMFYRACRTSWVIFFWQMLARTKPHSHSHDSHAINTVGWLDTGYSMRRLES